MRNVLKMQKNKKILPLLFRIAIALSFFGVIACQEEALSQMPRNIHIEVEFNGEGVQKKAVRGLGQYEKTVSSQYTKQSIVVSDGLTGSIRVGEDVPYVEYYSRYLAGKGYTEMQGIVFKEVGTKLVVNPKIRGDYIEISVTPQISYVSEDTSGTIDIKEVTTTVFAVDGQPISIGGLFKDEEFSNYFFKTKTKSNLDIILTPHVR